MLWFIDWHLDLTQVVIYVFFSWVVKKLGIPSTMVRY